MKRIYQNCLSGLLLSFTAITYAQVGVNTTNPQAQLDIVASNPAAPSNTDGFLVPRIDAFPATNPTATQQGMLVYLTTVVGVNQPGFYFWDHATTSWKAISAAPTSNDWSINGNAGTTSGTHFIGTTDNQALDIRTNNTIKVRITSKGQIEVLNTGESVFIGENAGQNDDLSANQNVFVGANSGRNNTTGTGNTFVGQNAGTNTTTGTANVFIGRNSGNFNSTGTWNNALGDSALLNNSTGNNNIAFGRAALANNSTGDSNIAIGRLTLASKSLGSFNTAIGDKSFWINNNGNNNVGLGADTGSNNANGSNNTFLGHNSGFNNNGSSNVFIGNQSGYNETGSDKLYIDNSNTASPLIYGDFASDTLRVNGTLNVNNAYNFPTTDGTANQVLQTDGAGNTTWVNPTSTAETDPQVSSATTNYVPKWNGTTLVDGQIFDNGTNIGIGTITPTGKVHVVGNVKVENGKMPFVNAGNSVYIGDNSGNSDPLTTALGNVGVGKNTLANVSTFSGNTAIGNEALKNNTRNSNTAIGYFSLRNNTTGSWNVGLGQNSLISNTTGYDNIGIGGQALFNNTTGTENVALGDSASFNNTTGNSNVVIGNDAGFSNTTGSRNVFIGNSVGYSETGSDKLYIDNSNTTNPLIYGDFASNLLRVNGTLNVNNAYNLPATAGTANQVLQTNGAGVASWVNPSSLSISETDPQVSSATPNKVPKWNGTTLVDGQIFDNGTNIGVGTLTPTDKVHVVGNIKVDAGKIPFVNTGESVFIGENAGLNDDLSANQNVFIGTNAGQDNVTGNSNVGIGKQSLYHNTSSNNSAVGNFSGESLTTGFNNVIFGESAMRNSISSFRNVAIGSDALRNNANGIENVALGFAAGRNNISGTGNVFLGNEAGENETTSNKLYIDNTSTATPLIYGDFASDILRVNGTLNVNNAYNLPTTAGAANQVLQTDGAGVASWVNPTSLSISETDPQVSSTTTNYLPKWNGTTLVDGEIFDNGTNIGIGTTTPSEKLEVNGKTKTTNIQVTNGATTGFVMQSDATGNGTWVDPSTLSVTETDPQVSSTTTNYIPKWDGTTLVDGQVFDNGTNVGVGTGTPSDKVHVVGNIKVDGGKIPFVNTGQSVFIGDGAGLNDDLTTNYNTFVGNLAGRNNTSGGENAYFGFRAGLTNTTGTGNVAFGFEALRNSASGNQNIALGFYSLRSNISGGGNVALGTYAGQNNMGNRNVFIGYLSGQNETGSEKLYIDNTSTNTPLIYGDFATDLLRVNGTLNVNNAYNLPTTSGIANQVLQTNGAGITTWVDSSSLSITETDPQVSSTTTNYLPKWNGTTLIDGQVFDNGTNVGVGTATPTEKLEVNGKTKTTNIQVTGGATNGYVLQSDATGNGAWVNPTSLSITETDPQVASTISNKIPRWNGTSLVDGAMMDDGSFVGIGATVPQTKLHVVGTVRVEAGRLDFRNTGGTTAVGTDAGINDDHTTNYNTYVGYFSGKASTSGYDNVAIGAGALENTSTGFFNTALGRLAGLNNSTGKGNVFLGYAAGYNETGSDKLYIDNSSTSSPLIYGDFGTNLLRVNGTLNINNAYNLPTTAGTANQILQTDGAGTTAWVDSSTITVTETDPQVSSTTTNYIPKWNGTTLVDGQMFDNGVNVGIGNNNPNALLTIGATMTPLPFLPKVSVNTTGNSPLFIGETTGQKGLILGYDGNNIQGRSGANFTLNSDLILNNYGGNVGVGTASPTEKLDINGKTKTTHVQITNGATSGYVLQSDATGNGTWVNPTSLSIAETDPQVSSTTTNYVPKWNGTTLIDGQVYDSGTNVGIGTSTPTDKVHVVGNIKVDGGKLPFINTGGSVFIGLDAGLNDDLVTNDNTYVGGNAGKANVGGIQNVALGSGALELNTNSRNTAVGFNALNSNVNGTNNLALGNYAGATSTGSGNILIGGGAGESTLGSNNILIGTDVGKTNTLSNKLMIDNSGVGNPLIWGDFAADLLRVNGTLNINNAYNLPTTSGIANQVLQTNGAGATS